MILPPGKGNPIKCDLCSGDPQCVKICEVHAIEYKDTTTIRAERRKATAQALIINPVELRKKKTRDYGEPSPWSPSDYEGVDPIP
jgi:ferredoxin